MDQWTKEGFATQEEWLRNKRRMTENDKRVADGSEHKHIEQGTTPNPEGDKYKTPTMFQMIASFIKDFATYLKNGAKNVSIGDYRQRLGACGECPHLDKKNMRCGLCGCLVEHKAKWKNTTCPDTPQRWAPQTPEYPGK